MRVLKRLSAVVSAAVFAVLLLFGCSVSSVSDGSGLPADGIVGQSVFQNAKKNSEMLKFSGKAGSFSYSWFFDGAEISAPADQDLKIDLSDAGNDLKGAVVSSCVVRLRFSEKNPIQAKTALQIDFPNLLDARKIRVYREMSGKISRILEAPLNNGKISSVTLPVGDTDGDFYLAAIDSSFFEDSSKVSSEPETGVSSGEDADSLSPDTGASSRSAGADGKDAYQTDPTPSGGPKPAEPQSSPENTGRACYCTLSIDCKTVLDSIGQLSESKKTVVPSDGVILSSQNVLFYQGESVFDILLRETKKNKIQMEYKATPIYGSSYIEGIGNLYELDCGSLSGWMYEVDGWYPNYGCSRYLLKDGNIVNWRYTCDLGRDVGCGWNVSQE